MILDVWRGIERESFYASDFLHVSKSRLNIKFSSEGQVKLRDQQGASGVRRG